jgi:hypothetical protein
MTAYLALFISRVPLLRSTPPFLSSRILLANTTVGSVENFYSLVSPLVLSNANQEKKNTL